MPLITSWAKYRFSISYFFTDFGIVGGPACPGEFVPDRNDYFYTSRVDDHVIDIAVTLVVLLSGVTVLLTVFQLLRLVVLCLDIFFSLDVLFISSNRCENGN